MTLAKACLSVHVVRQQDSAARYLYSGPREPQVTQVNSEPHSVSSSNPLTIFSKSTREHFALSAKTRWSHFSLVKIFEGAILRLIRRVKVVRHLV